MTARWMHYLLLAVKLWRVEGIFNPVVTSTLIPS